VADQLPGRRPQTASAFFTAAEGGMRRL
jgi:hypothetical protein